MNQPAAERLREGKAVRPWLIVVGIAALLMLVATGTWALAARRELAELRAASTTASAPASNGSSSRAPPPGGVARGQPSATPEEQRAQILEAHGREPVDAKWHSEAETRLDDLLRHALPRGSRRVSLACRTTTCKLEVSHRDRAAAQGEGLMKWVFSLTEPGAWSGQVFISGEREEGGEVLQTLVLFRDAGGSGANPPSTSGP